MKKLVLISFCFFTASIFANVESFNQILKKDALLLLKQKKLKANILKIKNKKTLLENEDLYVPSETDFLNLLSKLWLVKNKKNLKWDIQLTKFIDDRSDLSILYHNDRKLLNFVLPTKDKPLVVLNSKYMKLLDLNDQEENIMIDLLVHGFKASFSPNKVIHPFILKKVNKKSIVKKEYIYKSLDLLNKFIVQYNLSLTDKQRLSDFTKTYQNKKLLVKSLKSFIYKKSLVHNTLKL